MLLFRKSKMNWGELYLIQREHNEHGGQIRLHIRKRKHGWFQVGRHRILILMVKHLLLNVHSKSPSVRDENWNKEFEARESYFVIAIGR